MANITQIQKHINKGYAKVAQVIGDPYSWYRPDMPLAPIAQESFLGTFDAQFSPDAQFAYYRSTDFPTAERWFGAFKEQASVQPGDYFVGTQGTYYAVYVQRIASIQCVWCNRTVTVARAQDALVLGSSTEYGGQAVADPTPILQNWPVSLRQLGSGMKMRGTDMKFPSDAPLGAYGVFIPSMSSAPIQWNDIIIDDLGRRYAIATLEQTPLGWRISMEMWPT